MASKFRNLGIGIGVTTGTVIGFGSSAACDFATAMVCSPANPSIVAGFAAAGGAIGGAVGGTAGAIYDYVFGNKDGSQDANYVTPNQDPDRFVRGPRGTGVKVDTEDGSYWDRDRAGRNAHGGDQWKRWPNKNDWENQRNRESVFIDGTVRGK